MARTRRESQVPAVVDEKPSYLAAMEKSGPASTTDNFDQSDIVVPRIKLLQALSTEIESFNEAQTGRFWHTGFDMDLGEQLDFVVCSRRKKYLLVTPMEDGQGVLARADDAVTWDRTGKWQVKMKGIREPVVWEIADTNVVKSGLDAWGASIPSDENSPPAATLFYEYLVILPDHMDLGPAVVSLARSQIRRAKKGLNDKIQLHGAAGRPMQSLGFRALPIKDKNADGQEFRNWQFTANGFASEPLFNAARELETALSEFRVSDEDGAVAEQTGGASTEGDSQRTDI